MNTTASFPAQERALLLRQPRLGPVVVERLEQAGFHSLEQLLQAGAAEIVERMCVLTGSRAWINRRRAIEAVLALAAERAAEAHSA